MLTIYLQENGGQGTRKSGRCKFCRSRAKELIFKKKKPCYSISIFKIIWLFGYLVTHRLYRYLVKRRLFGYLITKRLNWLFGNTRLFVFFGNKEINGYLVTHILFCYLVTQDYLVIW